MSIRLVQDSSTPEEDKKRSGKSRDRWMPKSLLCLQGYTAKKFIADLIAGLTVGLVALPLAMAFGIASGVPPQ